MANSDCTRRAFLSRGALLAGLHAPLLSGCGSSAWKALKPFHLRRLGLVANNLDEQAAFYRDVLRLPVTLPDGDTLRVTAGTSILEFRRAPGVVKPFYHFAFTIPENQLAAGMAWLEPRCPILPIRDTAEKVMHFRGWNADSFYFNDPAGNILEFIVHHDLDNGTSKPFTEEHLLRICEIGIVVPDVPTFQQNAKKAMGIDYYREATNTFAPVGSIEGVLIVVQDDRVWLPTMDVHAAVFPTEVEATGYEGSLYPEGRPYALTASA